ncbi:hypothetical protein EUGRSUZ_H04247 [Eucalyptus grandis]|uniref:Uncharacterized protein n=2 Tax=Eucalyptus grandis TaxID=71139 RepID=A0ACC3JWH9_EUCGR|nr:hypothetical protein EUGRSUZ_H04247 [Eucalyptus grandis]
MCMQKSERRTDTIKVEVATSSESAKGKHRSDEERDSPIKTRRKKTKNAERRNQQLVAGSWPGFFPGSQKSFLRILEKITPPRENPEFCFSKAEEGTAMQSRNQGNYRNPCLTMHQPWASLLMYGIKRIEGRSSPAPIRGCLWIHATSKVPDESTIKAMEEFYGEIYAVNGITKIKFPEHYPVSRLQGCVEVVGCVPADELACWNGLPEGVGYTDLLLALFLDYLSDFTN